MLVVGAGPVGLLTALELAVQGVRPAVIDQRTDRGRRSKATTLWPRQLEILARHGLADDVIKRGARLDRVTVQTPTEHLATFDQRDLRRQTTFPFGVSLPQPVLEGMLLDAALAHGVQVTRPARFVGVQRRDDGLVVQVDQDDVVQPWPCSFLVGADGVDSDVRSAAGIPYEVQRPTLTFAITDVRLDGEVPASDLGYHFAADGALGLVPMGDDVFRIAVGVGDEGSMLGRSGFQRMLDDRTPYTATVGEPPWESHFQVQFRHARQYHQGRVAIAGDAAHSMSPAGGQGMNTGLQDAVNLGWRLAMALQHPELTAPLLEEYTRERRRDVLQVMRTSKMLTRLGADRSKRALLQRYCLTQSIRHVPLVRHRLTTRMAQLATSYAPRPTLRGTAARGSRLWTSTLPTHPPATWTAWSWRSDAPGFRPVPETPQARQYFGPRPQRLITRPDGHIHDIRPT